MLTVPRLKNIFLRQPLNAAGDPMHTSAVQFKAWRKASRRMGWSIGDEEFDAVAQLPLPCITDEDRNQGFLGTALFYGFGDDGSGGSDAVLSAKLAWVSATWIATIPFSGF